MTDFPGDAAMVARRRADLDAGVQLHESEVAFLKHDAVAKELMENDLDFKRAHEVALRTHGRYAQYHPDVVREFGDWFSLNGPLVPGLPDELAQPVVAELLRRMHAFR